MIRIIMNNLLDEYNKEGYFIQKNFFDQNFIISLLEDIDKAEKLKNVDVYSDKSGLPRRIERLYDKGDNLNQLNLKVSNFLENIFRISFLIFKDKFNSKPPGGEGYKAHFDGIFKFLDKNNKERNGWYEYSNVFVNVLIALDQADDENGTLQISKVYKDSFNNLYLKTLKDGSPNLTNEFESSLEFKSINLNAGDILVFDNRCPHRSEKNISKKSRRILYYTYSPKSDGSHYEKYFYDKKNSKNLSNKALIGDK